MLVENAAVDEIEDVSGYDGRKSHGAPIDAHSRRPKSVCDKSWVDAKERAVGEPCEAGEEKELVRVLQGETDDLRGGKNARRADQSPESRGVVVDEPVRADS